MSELTSGSDPSPSSTVASSTVRLVSSQLVESRSSPVLGLTTVDWSCTSVRSVLYSSYTWM